MKWYDACRDSTMRRARREDELGEWRVTVDGHCELVARDSKDARDKGYQPDQIYDQSTSTADRFSDWDAV